MAKDRRRASAAIAALVVAAWGLFGVSALVGQTQLAKAEKRHDDLQRRREIADQRIGRAMLDNTAVATVTGVEAMARSFSPELRLEELEASAVEEE